MLHPGWLSLKQWATGEWQAQINQHIEITTADTDDVQALSRLRQIVAAKRAVELVLTYPERRLTQMQAKVHAALPMMRGGLS